MISRYIIFSILFALLVVGCNPVEEQKKEEVHPALERDFFLLRAYSFNSLDQVATTDEYLKNSYMPALKEMGIENIGVFKSRVEESDTTFQTFLLFSFESLDQLPSFDESLMENLSFFKNGSDYLHSSHEMPPYSRFENVILKSFENMPLMQAPLYTNATSDRVYELRSYESPSETHYRTKVDMFNAGGEIELFDKLGFNAVFYGDVIAGASMPNLMYMTTFSDMESRDAHWKSFVDSPEWKEMSSLEKYQNNVSSINVMLLYPAEYSDY